MSEKVSVTPTCIAQDSLTFAHVEKSLTTAHIQRQLANQQTVQSNTSGSPSVNMSIQPTPQTNTKK
jgi:hypothetical protein